MTRPIYIPPPGLEPGSLPPEGNALSTELWGLARLVYHSRPGSATPSRFIPRPFEVFLVLAWEVICDINICEMNEPLQAGEGVGWF